MISAPQRKALAVLAALCELPPYARLGQLHAYLGFLSRDRSRRVNASSRRLSPRKNWQMRASPDPVRANFLCLVGRAQIILVFSLT